MNKLAFLLALCTCLLGCQSSHRFQPIDFNKPGWDIREGQAVWQLNREAPEIAGEILVAKKANGQIVVQFTKTPFPFVIAQLTPGAWQIEFPAENKRYSGNREPPTRLSWLHLAKAFQGAQPEKPWVFRSEPDNRWRLQNERTGEVIEGFLNP